MEYDFVEELSQDYMCPVTWEVLRDPQQTTCCGHHLSLEAATTLQQDGKSCPICNEPNLATVPDKFHKRKVNDLKVRCSNKKNGCGWVGDFRSLGQHSDGCAKRPWQCDYCDFKGTYDEIDDHIPLCVKPCPNHCEVSAISCGDLEKHLSECPLQPVECEFAGAGCKKNLLRQDLSRHMKEGAQRHLLIVQEQNKELRRKLEQMRNQIAESDEKNAAQQQLVTKLRTHLQPLAKFKKDVTTGFGIRLPIVQEEMVIKNFSKRKRSPNWTPYGKPHFYEYCSEQFYSYGNYLFQYTIHILQNGCLEGYLYLLTGEHDDTLRWPIQIIAGLVLLNQLEDRGHCVAVTGENLGKSDRDDEGGITISEMLIDGSDLGFNAERHTQFLKDDSLYFRLYLSVVPKRV